MCDEEDRTVWVGNLDSEQVTEDVLFELFLQAGPVQYVRIAKDRATGMYKNFAFVIYRDPVSVPYAIELMNGIPLFNRNMKVQNRGLQELQQRGLAPGPGGIHTLDPSLLNNSPQAPQQNYPSVQAQSCGQQQSLLGPGPGIPAALQGRVPQHIMALAQQQIALLQAQQPCLLSDSPLLNAPSMRSSDRLGSVNYGMYGQGHRGHNMQNNMRGSGSRTNDSPHNQHWNRGHHYNNRDRNSRSLDDRHNRHHEDRNRYGRSLDDHQSFRHNQRSGGQKYIDNDAMKMLKGQQNREDSVSQNSNMLAQLQQQQGRFDYNRLGPKNDSYTRPNGHSHDSHRSRDHYHSRSHGNDDRSSGRYDPYRSSRR
ncbi:RNA-binding protein 7-like [Penaeus monodon]|uniref:RNA-binding protein 7-like n=1 Tax=Penaeus monodon TaxID=6687 RepID=UPI0018A6DC85|nr:RNA-binding protein 7-like [Penaeus monodon]